MIKPSQEELTIKLQRMLALLDKHQADALLLRRVSSFAWATGGAVSYINTATTEGGASLLMTRDQRYLITNNIEAPRMELEEDLPVQGWELNVSPWRTPLAGLNQLVQGRNVIADVAFPGTKDIGGEIARLRARLTETEGERFRQLARLCAEAMQAAALAVRPGMSEYQIAGLLGGEAQSRGVQPIVNLIATDERVYQFRHPLPTDKKLDRHALLVLSGRKWGLVCSISRLVHFGQIPAELRARMEATNRVNAAFIAHTRPGRSLGEIFAEGQKAYAEVGFAEEWQQHHQGGVVGYEPREYLGMPGAVDLVSVGQALSWNPTIAGAKAEDTILVGAKHNEIITQIPGWPAEKIRVPGVAEPVVCPLALEIV